MSIEVKCPECQSLLRIADENAGRQARCPSCQAVFTAQAAPPPVPDPAPTTPLEYRPRAGGVRMDPTNPYAPSTAETSRPTYTASDWAPRTITPDEVFSKTWAIFKEQWLFACAAVLIIGGFNFAISIVETGIIQGMTAAGAARGTVLATQIGVGIVRWCVQMWLQIGQTLVMLDIARGRSVALTKLFAGHTYLIHTIIAVILVGLIVGAIAIVLVGLPAGVGYLVTQDANATAIVALVSFLVAFIPIIVVSLMYSQIQLLVIDREVSGLEALRISREITNGNKLTIFLIGIMMVAIGFAAAIVGLLLLCVGIIPAMIGVSAYGALVLVVAYLCMTGQYVAEPSPTVNTGPADFATS